MTNRNRNIALIIGFFVAILICYQLAFSKTFELRSEYQELSKEELLFKNIPKQLSILKQKEQFYDSILSKNQLKSSSIQNNLLNTINNYAQNNNLKVVSFLEPHIHIQNEGLTIKIYQFTLEGDYNSILKVIYHLEQKTKFGEIINLQFEKKKNFKTGNYYLQASVLLKSLG
jgi:hypothetical protein